MDTPGCGSAEHLRSWEPGSGWASHGEIAYEDVRVPRENVLGEPGAGFIIAQARLGPGRIHHCMRWIGICQRAFELLCDRACVARAVSRRGPWG
jgi:alkylation response protein AidB-like acyl-CoA dehydrogenase